MLAEWRVALAHPGSVRRMDVRAVRPDGSHIWVDATVVNMLEDPKVQGVAVHARNIDERRRAADRLFHLALHDPLTGLPNRQHFGDHLDALMADPETGIVTVLYCDLVGFKPVNDTMGHAVGDALLKQVAQRLWRAVRPVDLVARIGGDEFCIVCQNLDRGSGAEIASRIVDAMSQSFAVEDHEVNVAISIGIAEANGGRSTDLLRRADAAMYRAKAKGPNQFEVAEA
jgi:diguanylate cyclase (GGDEF)-like protein